MAADEAGWELRVEARRAEKRAPVRGCEKCMAETWIWSRLKYGNGRFERS
jgi:hypothetical protein